ncbi:reverse transcriptase domain-containing protein [Tanacetum coccineum]
MASHLLPKVAHVLPRIDNAAKDEDPNGQPAAESLGGGTGVRVGRGGRGRRPREEGANGNVRGGNGGPPRFCDHCPTIAEPLTRHASSGRAVVLIVGLRKWCLCMFEWLLVLDQKSEIHCGSFVGKALTWWNSQIRTLSREVVVSMSWNDFKFMMIQEFCPSHEMQKLKSELWNHAMVGAGHVAYTDRFHELARLVPHLVTPESRMIERYAYGLALQIRGIVAATEPKTIIRRCRFCAS